MSVHRPTAIAAENGEMQIISVLSGKGGVGKSVIAFNLAERLSADGSVLLVDADVYTGNAHILANTNCEYGWHEYVNGQLTIQEAVTKVTPSLYLLASPKSPTVGEEAGAGDVARAIERLRRDGRAFQYVIVDHPSGVSETAIVIAQASDLNLLVVLPELTSISDAYGLFKHLYEANSILSAALLVNRCETSGDGEFIRQKFGAVAERFIGKSPEFLGHLSEDSAWRKAVASQTAVALAAPESIAAKELNVLCQNLRNISGKAPQGSGDRSSKPTNYQPAQADIRE